MTTASQRDSMLTVGVVLPTRNAGPDLSCLLAALQRAACVDRVLVIDSGSTDASVENARKVGVEVIEIEPGMFNHGLTREMGRRHLGTDIVVMISQDVEIDPADDPVGSLVAPISAGRAALAFGRQLPRRDASFIEAFLRIYNYPAQSYETRRDGSPQARSAATPDNFFSNSFGAYLNRALESVGGFPEVPSNEDSIVAALLLNEGQTLAYVADAHVRHSHPVRLAEEFRRNSTAAKARRRHPDASRNIELVGSGRRFASSIVLAAVRQRLSLLPWVLTYLGTRAAGTLAGSLPWPRDEPGTPSATLKPHSDSGVAAIERPTSLD